MNPAENLVQRFYHELWNQADEAVAREILCPDFRFRGSLGPEKIGVDGFLSYMREVHAALADYRCDILDLVSQDQRVAARMRFGGRQQGPLLGVASTDRHLSWSGAAFFEMETIDPSEQAGSKLAIARLWVLGDLDSLKQQLASP